jgi:hypothetical protein
MEETTRGTFEAPGAPTAALFITQTPQMDVLLDNNVVVHDVLGSRDAAHILKTGKALQFAMAIPNIIVPETINFLKRGINLEAGAGTIEKLFSMVIREKLGATQYYLRMKGLMIYGGTISLAGAGPWTSQLIMGGIVSAYSTVAPTNWTFTTPPTTAPLLSKDAGANHVTIRDVVGALDYNPSVRALSVSFNNFPFPIWATGSDTWADQLPTRRGAQVVYVSNQTTIDLFTLHDQDKEVNSTIVMKAAGSTITLTGGKIARYHKPYSTDAILSEQYLHVAKSIALA